MTTNQAIFTAPAQALFPALPAVARNLLLAVAGSLILWASAKVQVPFWPVPMTMQPMVVLLLGALYGPRLAVATILLYLAEGAVGLPVFAGTPERGIGLPYMLGPTGGYMVGWLASAALVGYVFERSRKVLPVLLVMLAGVAVMYTTGFAWLATHIGVAKAFTAGVAPFVLGDVLKAGLATALALGAVRATRR